MFLNVNITKHISTNHAALSNPKKTKIVLWFLQTLKFKKI